MLALAYSNLKCDLRYLNEILPALFHGSERHFVPPAVECALAPIAAARVQHGHDGVRVEVHAVLKPLQPILRMPDLNRHLHRARKHAEFFGHLVDNLLAVDIYRRILDGAATFCERTCATFSGPARFWSACSRAARMELTPAGPVIRPMTMAATALPIFAVISPSVSCAAPAACSWVVVPNPAPAPRLPTCPAAARSVRWRSATRSAAPSNPARRQHRLSIPWHLAARSPVAPTGCCPRSRSRLERRWPLPRLPDSSTPWSRSTCHPASRPPRWSLSAWPLAGSGRKRFPVRFAPASRRPIGRAHETGRACRHTGRLAGCCTRRRIPSQEREMCATFSGAASPPRSRSLAARCTRTAVRCNSAASARYPDPAPVHLEPEPASASHRCFRRSRYPEAASPAPSGHPCSIRTHP